MSEKQFPPLLAVVITDSDRHMKIIANACLAGAIAQSAITLAVIVILLKVYAWKDLDYALHIAFLSLGLMAIMWLVYMLVLIAAVAYSLFCSIFLFRAAFVFSTQSKRALRAWWIEAIYGIFPCGTLAGIYFSRQRKKWLREIL